MTPEERATLLDSLLEGQISEADHLRIEAELTVDASVRQEYYRRIQLGILLEREAMDPPPSLVPAKPPRSWRTGRATLWSGILLGMAASLLLVISSVPWIVRAVRDQAAPAIATVAEPSASGFAILSGQSQAVWTTNKIADGDLIPEGLLHLKAGRVAVELFSGVQLVIEGESVFSIDSPMQVTIRSGRARALVPEPATGFRIKTRTGDVVDLGTEFSVHVADGDTDVQVIAGEVELSSAHAAVRRIKSGDSVRLSQEGIRDVNASEDFGLIGPEDFQDLLMQRRARQLERWQQATEQLKDDPRLIAYYQIDPQQKTRHLHNLAVRSSASEGAVVAAQPSVDRWGRSGGALDFSSVGSRIRVTVPGEHRGLTLSCWVKINSLDRWYNSLFLTDGHEEGEPHWQLMDDGRIFFSVKIPVSPEARANGQGQQEYYSPKIWDDSLSGRWIMLSVTYDVERRQVTHYLNGKPISTEPIPANALVESIQVGNASICNWSEPMYRTDPNFVLRNLNGSLDEFALFNQALHASEIMKLFQTGNPNEL